MILRLCLFLLWTLMSLFLIWELPPLRSAGPPPDTYVFPNRISWWRSQNINIVFFFHSTAPCPHLPQSRTTRFHLIAPRSIGNTIAELSCWSTNTQRRWIDWQKHVKESQSHDHPPHSFVDLLEVVETCDEHIAPVRSILVDNPLSSILFTPICIHFDLVLKRWKDEDVALIW